MIVLLQEDADSIIVTLTTSKDKVPSFHKGKRCVVDHDNGVHFYYMPKGHQVGKNGFAFPDDTWVQFYQNIKRTSVTKLSDTYLQANNAMLVCELHDSEYSDLLYCIYKSKFVPRGIRRSLEPIIERIEQAHSKE